MPDNRIPAHLHRIVIPVQSAFRSRLSHPDRWLFAAVAALALYALIAGLWHVSTNYDSLTYHLARTGYWQQNRSIDFYTTPIDRQLYNPPLSSIGMMLVNMLTGTDRLAFILQWLSYVGCMALVWKIARKLNTAPALAVVFAASIPTAFLEAGSTQNDLITAFWLCCVIWFILDDAPLYVGIAAGLCLLTKSTAYIYLAPLLLWFVARQVSKHDMKRLVFAGILALALNAPQWARSTLWFGSPISSGIHDYTNDELSPRVLLSSVARNLALHVSLPADDFTAALGLDVNDPGITWDGNPGSMGITYWTDSSGGAPLHVTLLIICLPLALWKRNTRVLSACLLLSFLLFCLLLKWQMWHVRLHMPLLIAWSPVVAICVPRAMHRGLSVVLLLFAIVVVFTNDERPPQRWFTQYRFPAYEAKYMAFAEMAKEEPCRLVYLHVGSNEPVYALFRLMPGYRFTHDPTDKQACMTFYAYDTSGARQSGG